MTSIYGWEAPTFKQLQKKDSILSLSFNESKFKYDPKTDNTDLYSWEIDSLKVVVKKPSGQEIEYVSQLIVSGSHYIDTEFSIALNEEGEYKIKFLLKYSHRTYYYSNNTNDPLIGTEIHRENYSGECLGYFAVAPEEVLSPYTIKDVIDRVLAVTPTRTTRGENKYRFYEDAAAYATEESPEFTFTGKHLFEVMLDIASYKKMFPALYKNEIYFRPFWNGIMLTSDDLPPPTKAVMCSAIDQYCTALDSYVENMVCVNDTNVGTVVEPYKGGYISARSESGSEISETTAVIPTQSGVYQSLALNMGEVNGEIVGDIQSYVYEQENYDSLSDTSSAYPYSKGYALKFKRFEKNYTELAHRIKKDNELSSALTYPALANITKAKCGEEVGMNLKTYLSAFIGENTAAPFADLLFQPTYIPVVNARVRQYKPMISAEDCESTLFYNQQSEVVDSEAFGEHVKGLVQKLGNHTEIRVYRFERVDDIPTVGTLIDDKSVYNVAMTIYENHVDTTICLVDYAELSTYIGVKNEIKTSDISSTKWCNRFINWEEFLVFTHENETGDAVSISPSALNDITAFMTSKESLTCAVFTSYTAEKSVINTAYAPVKHLALGNSIYFQWEMLDNFAVGYKSEKSTDKATSLLTGSQYDRAQKAVRYCDNYGRMETLDFFLLKQGPTIENSSMKIPTATTTVSGGVCTVNLSHAVGAYLHCWIYINTESKDAGTIEWMHYYEFAPNEISYSFDVTEADNVMGVGFDLATTAEQEKGAYMRTIAHAFPEKPDELIFMPEQKDPSFGVLDLIVKKDSAEALKFAVQYHFRQAWREFVIGSGMSNFCSLVGGSCIQLQMFVSSLPINRFERHINFGDSDNYTLLDELPTFTVRKKELRIEIELPSKINDNIDKTKSWGLVGIDKNGNKQLIFGENKKSNGQNFETIIYLVAKRKNNELPTKATWSLTRNTSMADASCAITANGVRLTEFCDKNNENQYNIPRNAIVEIHNSYVSAYVQLKIDSKSVILPSNSTYSFQIQKDMEFSALVNVTDV